MKLKTTLIALMVTSVSLMAQPNGEKKEKEQVEQEIAMLEMELLKDYVDDCIEIEPTKVIFYNSEFELVKEAEIHFYDEHNEEIEHMILHSTLLIADGTERIYQIKK